MITGEVSADTPDQSRVAAYGGSQPKRPCRASKASDKMQRLLVEASESACADGEAYFCVLVSDCSQRAVRRANRISTKVKKRKRFRINMHRSSATKKRSRRNATTRPIRSS